MVNKTSLVWLLAILPSLIGVMVYALLESRLQEGGRGSGRDPGAEVTSDI